MKVEYGKEKGALANTPQESNSQPVPDSSLIQHQQIDKPVEQIKEKDNEKQDTRKTIKDAKGEEWKTLSQEYLDDVPENGFECLDAIKNPAEMLALFDPDIASRKTMLYKWQAETLEEYGIVKPTSQEPYQQAIAAANGSGKDAFIVSPLSIWFIIAKIQALVVITSSSGGQLTTQTERYIVALAHKANQWAVKYLGKAILKIRLRRITCLMSGSEIFLFATDEKEKAEGYHPTAPNAEMLIIVNEAKSVDPEIFEALGRCTGFNYWIDVSTPGEPVGDFYYHFENWPNKKRITYFDCPHQSKLKYEEDKKKYGEHSAYFRSKWLALFTFVGGEYVVSQESLQRLRSAIKGGYVKHIKQNDPLSVGLDISLSGNGDETSICAFRGNKQLPLINLRWPEATKLAEMIQYEFIHTLHLEKDHEYIYADDGGVGRAVIDILKKMGWINIHRVLNQSKAKSKQYGNRGAELWYKLARLIESQSIILDDSDELYKQIASRKYKKTVGGLDKLLLQNKKAMIAEGIQSPDRADATALAISHFNLLSVINAVETKKPTVVYGSQQDTIRNLERQMQQEMSKRFGAVEGKRVFNSLNAFMQGAKSNKRLLKYQ